MSRWYTQEAPPLPREQHDERSSRPWRKPPRQRPQTKADRLLQNAVKLHEELGEQASAQLKQAVSELDVLCLSKGGGGAGSTRSQLASLTSLARKLSDEPSSASSAPKLPTTGVVIVVHAFVGEDEGRRELPACRVGDMLTVLQDEATPPGWLQVQSAAGHRGLVPASHVQERVRVPGERIIAEASHLRHAASRRARSFRHDVVDVRCAAYMGCSVAEWRALPDELRPAHLLRLRTWDGKRLD